jgi:serine protease Do
MADKEKGHIEDHESDNEEIIVDESDDFYVLDDLDDSEEMDEEEFRPSPIRKWIVRIIALTLSLALLVNILAIWPKVINIPAIQFIKISRELSQNPDIQLYKKSVVVVEADNSRGTGFNIAPEGIIVTNHHVVYQANTISVRFNDGKVYQAHVMTNDPENDLAILNIQTEHLNAEINLPSLALANEMISENGDLIYFIGNPLSFSQIANQGRIIGTIPMLERNLEALAIDAPVYKGNSGSPVINQKGEVIAVIYATGTYSQGNDKQRVGLAIPITYLNSLLQDE